MSKKLLVATIATSYNGWSATLDGEDIDEDVIDNLADISVVDSDDDCGGYTYMSSATELKVVAKLLNHYGPNNVQVKIEFDHFSSE